MTNRKEYTLIGIGPDVQYGKGGGRFIWDIDHFVSTVDGVTLAQIRVPTVPVNDNDATSKIYVDGLVQGLDTKESVVAASTVAAVLATDFEAGDIIDGIALTAGDRILIKDQANPVENGIYIVAAVGIPTRAADADNLGDLSGGAFVFIEQGTTLADTGWTVSSNGDLTPGTDPIVWTQFSSAGIISAGIGLNKVGNVINAEIAASTVSVDGGNNLIVNSSAILNQTLVSAGTAGSEAVWGALPLADANATTALLRQDRGGLNTDISGFANESLFVMDATNGDVNELTIGTNGNALVVVGGVTAWGQINLADGINAVTGVLGETNGGTGTATYARGDILVSTAVDTLGALTVGTIGQVLQSDGVDTIWGPPLPPSGAVMTIEADITFGGGATQVVGTIPLGGRVIKTSIDVGTAWDQIETVEIGDAGVTDALMTAIANDPAEAIIFSTDDNVLYAAATVINATVTAANGATSGAAHVIVQYIAA